MSIGINKEEMHDAYIALQEREEIIKNVKIIEEQFEKMNNHSKKIIGFEGEMSYEGLQESGRIQGRIDMLKLIWEVFKIKI